MPPRCVVRVQPPAGIVPQPTLALLQNLPALHERPLRPHPAGAGLEANDGTASLGVTRARLHPAPPRLNDHDRRHPQPPGDSPLAAALRRLDGQQGRAAQGRRAARGVAAEGGLDVERAEPSQLALGVESIRASGRAGLVH